MKPYVIPFNQLRFLALPPIWQNGGTKQTGRTWVKYILRQKQLSITCIRGSWGDIFVGEQNETEHETLSTSRSSNERQRLLHVNAWRMERTSWLNRVLSFWGQLIIVVYKYAHKSIQRQIRTPIRISSWWTLTKVFGKNDFFFQNPSCYRGRACLSGAQSPSCCRQLECENAPYIISSVCWTARCTLFQHAHTHTS